MKHYTLKITLQYVTKPPVWRRVVVPADMNFADLHLVIQSVMPWDDYHLYEFTDVHPAWGCHDAWKVAIPHEDDDWFDVKVEDSRITLIDSRLEKPGDKLMYTYDFGDSWTHIVLLEELNELPERTVSCISGKGACPPEDVGGAPGYEQMKAIFAENPDGEEAQSYKEWLGYEDDEDWVFDPKAFDKDYANIELNLRFPKRKPRKPKGKI